MTDRLDALERLQRLRESGAISDAEFEREKQVLLGTAPATPIGYPSDPYPRPSPPGPGTRVWLWVLIGLVALALFAALAWLLLGSNQQRSETEVSVNRVEEQAAPETNVQAATPPKPGIRERTQPEQLAAAFRTAFGGRATRRVGEYDITYRAGALTWIGDRAALVSPGTNAEQCHACPGMLAVHYLEPEGDGFRVTGEYLSAGTDDYGEPPDWQLSSAFTGAPILRIASGGGNQGIFCNIVRLVDLAPGGPRELALIPIGYTDEGAAEEEGAGTELEGEIANIQRGRSFDVVYSGDERFTESWQLRGGRYELANGPTRMRTCG